MMKSAPPSHERLRLLDDHPLDRRFVLRLGRQRADRARHQHRTIGGVGHLAGQPARPAVFPPASRPVPNFAKATRFAPNVFVVSTSAPASRYSV